MNSLQEVSCFHRADIVKMIKKREFKKIFLKGILLGIFIIFSLNIVSAICCEMTINGGICLDVGNSQYCNQNYRIDDTACESTQYCSTGTCVNNAQGTCMASSSTACNPNLGGYWYDKDAEEIAECQYGCCFIGEGASFIRRTTCNKVSADIGVQPNFDDSITTQEECLLSAGPAAKGACVFQTDEGKKCTIETREKCNSEGKEFHAGLLCSAPELGTICTMTKRTTCVEGRNEVFFVDNCGNPANVYNSGLEDDVPYWTYIKDPASSEICGYGNSNADSPNCGNCNYLLGSTCREKRAGESVDSGNYICGDLSCNYNGEIKAHGSAWCSEPIISFEDAKPGDLSYRLYCYDGEVQWELCGNLREKLCKEDVPGEANCFMNRWQDCVFQNSSKVCLDTDQRDCKIEMGVTRKDENGDDILFSNYTSNYNSAGELINESIKSIKAMCVPKYPPGFNFWEPDAAILGVESQISPSQVCSVGSASSVAGYFKSVTSGWEAIEGKCYAECLDNCTAVLRDCRALCARKCPESESFMDKGASGELGVGTVDLKSEWAGNQEELCIVLGDCGVKSNYIQQNSYYSWKELFVGENVSKANIPEAESHK